MTNQMTSRGRADATRARSRLITLLLLCGVLSSVLYVGTEIAASMLYEGYSYTSQMVSELGAIGAPTRPLWILMSNVYNPLVIAFAVGVWLAAGQKRSLRITAVMLFGYGLVSGVGPYVPMHVRGAEASLTDLLHILCTVGMIAFMLAFVAFGSATGGKAWRDYSIATLIAIVVGGALAGWAGQNLASGGATPGFGLLERVNIYAEMAWIAALGVRLLVSRKKQAAARPAMQPAAAG